MDNNSIENQMQEDLAKYYLSTELFNTMASYRNNSHLGKYSLIKLECLDSLTDEVFKMGFKLETPEERCVIMFLLKEFESDYFEKMLAPEKNKDYFYDEDDFYDEDEDIHYYGYDDNED